MYKGAVHCFHNIARQRAWRVIYGDIIEEDRSLLNTFDMEGKIPVLPKEFRSPFTYICPSSFLFVAIIILYVQSVQFHPEYNNGSLINNLAILKTEKIFYYSDTIGRYNSFLLLVFFCI